MKGGTEVERRKRKDQWKYTQQHTYYHPSSEAQIVTTVHGVSVSQQATESCAQTAVCPNLFYIACHNVSCFQTVVMFISKSYEYFTDNICT